MTPSLPPPGHAIDRPMARRLLAVALAIGVFVEVVLDGPALGINVLLATAAMLAAAWLVRRRDRAPDPLDAWLPITALVLAGFVALRADPFLALLDLAGAAAATGASMVAFSGLAVTRRSATVVATMGGLVIEALFAGTARLLRASRPWLPARGERAGPSRIAPVARGLLLAAPIAAVFVVLFASADPIFARAAADVLGFRIDLGDVPGRIVVVVAVAWLAGGLLSVAARGLDPVAAASLGAAASPVPLAVPRDGPGFRLGRIETLIVLVAVDALVAAFVALQVAYLFGGADTLAASGLTYSDYARRGFFELVAAAGFAGAVVVGLELAVAERSRAQAALAIGLVAGILVVLASAALRLGLYQDAYGWTELRLYVAVAIGAMAVALVVLGAVVATGRIRWFGHALAVIGLGAILALDLLAPAHLVAERNLARAIDPSLVPPDGRLELDAWYVARLPDDAVPAIVAALPRLPAADAAAIRPVLIARRDALARDPALTSPFAWNLGRERARAALATLDRETAAAADAPTLRASP